MHTLKHPFKNSSLPAAVVRLAYGTWPRAAMLSPFDSWHLDKCDEKP